jgi:hypothetical protein
VPDADAYVARGLASRAMAMSQSRRRRCAWQRRGRCVAGESFQRRGWEQVGTRRVPFYTVLPLYPARGKLFKPRGRSLARLLGSSNF